MSRRDVIAAIGLALLWTATAVAQPFPNRPVKLVLTFAPGGGIAPAVTDLLGGQLQIAPTTPQQFAAFILAEQAKWGPVVVKTGARLD